MTRKHGTESAGSPDDGLVFGLEGDDRVKERSGRDDLHGNKGGAGLDGSGDTPQGGIGERSWDGDGSDLLPATPAPITPTEARAATSPA